MGLRLPALIAILCLVAQANSQSQYVEVIIKTQNTYKSTYSFNILLFSSVWARHCPYHNLGSPWRDRRAGWNSRSHRRLPHEQRLRLREGWSELVGLSHAAGLKLWVGSLGSQRNFCTGKHYWNVITLVDLKILHSLPQVYWVISLFSVCLI